MGIMSSQPKDPVREPKKGWDPAQWATRIPLTHIENLTEVPRAAWENRDNARYAFRILADGVCDGCALGTSGMDDWTIEGVHLCNVRLRLLRLSTMGPLDPALLADVTGLGEKRSRDLRHLGRIPHPLIRRRGETGFSLIGWEEAIDLIAERIRSTDPDRTYTYLTSRGIPNETYYSVQKSVRAMGTNNIDNAARVCHSPSTFALKDALGVAATTCSYSDLIGTDLVTFIGSNPAKNQPVLMKYLFHAKKAGTRVALVNPYLEPGMDDYWVPSDLESALFGTRITDHFFQVRPSGDIPFLHGAVKALIEKNAVDNDFVGGHTTGFDQLALYVSSLSWERIEEGSGLVRREIEAYADMVAAADTAVFVWGMGVTQHVRAEDAVQAIINVALTKGFVGRRGCGLMPIRGHSGVQGGAEMGAYATVLPGGTPLDAGSAARFTDLYGFEVRDHVAPTTPEMLDRAGRGEIDVLLAVGGNFREVMPGPARIRDALARIPLRVHLDIALSSQMLDDPADTVIVLPATTRYEMPGGVTETSTERRVIFSPEIPGPRIDQARPEWEVFAEIAARVRPDRAGAVRFAGTAAIRDEIASVIPMYDGIQHLGEKGDQFQYGGPLLCEGWVFPTADGRARFAAVALPSPSPRPDQFLIGTRRGKQFNSMVHQDHDPLNRVDRDGILMNAADVARLGLAEGDEITVVNDHGALAGSVVVADIAPGSLQVHWPEGNILVDPDLRSARAEIPAYKETVGRVEPGRRIDPDRVRV
ncbi:MAG TPA: FdhF/YdeP family oxidoreductase [Acidimicrobiia bacterium]|nr:FdhF/YdeP family oxidoreductase [Acidimicrobiia bacterium]